jgi:Amino acid kinase family
MLMSSDTNVVCAGGGGVPVIRNGWGRLEGVEAVVDKDFTAQVLAEALDADALVILTDVANVFRGFGCGGASNRSHHPDGVTCDHVSGWLHARLELCVHDDGIGVSVDGAIGGNGSGNLAVRAEQHGGTFRLDQGEPNGTTTATWSIPAPV